MGNAGVRSGTERPRPRTRKDYLDYNGPMIKEIARIAEIDESGVWIEPQRQSTCGGCSANKVCSVNALHQVLGNKRSRMRLLTDQPLSKGQLVLVGLEEDALAKGTLAVYGMPLLGLIVGAGIGEALALADGIVALAGITGLLLGLMGVRRFSRKAAASSDYQPQLLRVF